MSRYCLMVLLLLSSFLTFDAVQARPGGGHSSHSSSSHSSSHSSSSSYHSSSSSSSHSSGGSGSSMTGGEFLALLVIIVIIVLLIYAFNRNAPRNFVAGSTRVFSALQQLTITQQIAALKQSDANFSTVLFIDFAHSLFSKFYSLSTKPEFAYLSPFLSGELQQHFQKTSPRTVNEVVINGIKWLEVNCSAPDKETITLEIDANYTVEQQGKRSRYTVLERWQFYRQKGLLSAEPDKMRSLRCPHCGAPAHFTDAGVCGHCANVIHKGEQQWCLGKRVAVNSEAMQMSAERASYAVEQGSERLTVKQNDLFEQMNQWQQRYGIADWQAFWEPFEQQVVRAYFNAIYQHWSQRNWQAARHLLSDRLYESNAFWQNLYVEQNWFNRLDQLTIRQVVLAKIESDRFYEAITVRIFAACYDYTEDANGKLIGGSKKSPRQFTEYWTFVRRTGQERNSKPYSVTQCPQCGAQADNVGHTSECGYCGSTLSSGDFSWVLFAIVQDEVYAG